MLAKNQACAAVGLEGRIVEVDISSGLPAFALVGLAMAAIEQFKL